VTVQACQTDDAACWRQKAARAEEARQDAQQQLEEARQKAKQQREDCIMETGDYERC
jgi:F0F1-type ATP synthase membrane subunit b/b'